MHVMCCDYNGSRLFMGYKHGFENTGEVFTYENPERYCLQKSNVNKCDEGDVKSIEWRLKILKALKKKDRPRYQVLDLQEKLFLSTKNLLDRYKIATCDSKDKCKEKVEKVLLSTKVEHVKVTKQHKEHLDPLREMKYLLGITENYVLYRPDLEVDTNGKSLELSAVYDYFETEKELNDAVFNLKQIACLETGSNASADYQSNQHAYPANYSDPYAYQANHSNPYASQANYSDPYAYQANHSDQHAYQANHSNPQANPAKNVWPKRIVIAVGSRVKTDLPASQGCQKVSDATMEKFFELYELRFKAIRYLRKVKSKCKNALVLNPFVNSILMKVESGKDGPVKKRILFRCKDPIELNMFKTLWTHGDFLDRFGWIEEDENKRIFNGLRTYSFVKSGLFQSDFKSFNYEPLKQKYERIIKEVETWLETK